jgi:hypothetical protein
MCLGGQLSDEVRMSRLDGAIGEIRAVLAR